MSLKDDYQRKVDAKVAQWDAEISLLKTKAQNVEIDIKIKENIYGPER